MGLLPEDPQQRNRVVLGVMLVAGLGYFGYEYVYSPRAEALAQMEARLENLQLQNQTARALTGDASRAEVERRLAVYRQQLERVEGLIPSSEELPDLLDAISAEAQRTGVELSLIQPVGATAEQFYTRRSYDLAVLGSYHQIGEFLANIASLSRIITPINLNVTVRSDGEDGERPQLEAKFGIETYVLPPADARADTAESTPTNDANAT